MIRIGTAGAGIDLYFGGSTAEAVTALISLGMEIDRLIEELGEEYKPVKEFPTD